MAALRHVPESRDPEAVAHLDVPGTALALSGLGALTWALTEAGTAGASASVIVTGLVGVGALVAFGFVERRSRSPLVPTDLFKNPLFSALNVVTLLVYAALGVLFVLLVLQLQVVAGFSPLGAGVATLPITVIMLLLSARAGRLAAKIGPRIPMTVGLVTAACGMLLLLRVGVGASYWFEVLPAVLVFGLGLSATVAPLTATVLDAADDRHAGVASGVNNAVARAAGLLAVAVIPAAAGIAGADYTNPVAFSAGYHRAVIIAACLLLGGAVLSGLLLRPLRPRPPGEVNVAECVHCGVSSPQQSPRS